ncbi:MAG: hypothetical protein KJZ96_15595 [Rhodocyclaceae bacterium]|nr:hypothetical protein [Rhodocyclaceae bacterium]
MRPVGVLALFLLLVAAVLAAPHMTWPEARGLALVAVAAGVVFGAIAMRLS